MIEELDSILQWLKPKLDSAQKELHEAERDYKDPMCGDLGMYELIRVKARLDTLVEIKKGVERYKKKIKYQSEE